MNIKTVKTEWDVYFDMALKMLDIIMKNNEKGKKTVMIVPVGPTDQYPILAKMINQLRVSLKNVYFFNMDEYMIDPYTLIDSDNFMSFKKRMNDEFYSLVDKELVMPKSQRLFPKPDKTFEYDKMIEDLGGVDLCLGGLGINGHIAFNEPEESDSEMTVDEFSKLGTRVLKISRETRTINAFGYQRGDIRNMPEWCITIGMKQILESKSIYIALNRPWQHGIFKHILTDEVQPQIPASLLKNHSDVTFCVTEEIVNGLPKII